jgi:hypothetical protein
MWSRRCHQGFSVLLVQRLNRKDNPHTIKSVLVLSNPKLFPQPIDTTVEWQNGLHSFLYESGWDCIEESRPVLACLFGMNIFDFKEMKTGRETAAHISGTFRPRQRNCAAPMLSFRNVELAVTPWIVEIATPSCLAISCP